MLFSPIFLVAVASFVSRTALASPCGSCYKPDPHHPHEPPPPKPPKSPVCIIGAGPAGLSAANVLEGKGRDTIIFEKQDDVGGKNQAVYEGDHFYPLGAVLFTKATYVETFKIIEQTHVPYVNFSHGGRYSFDWKTGGLASIVVPDPIRQALIQEFGAYTQLWRTKFAPFSSLGFKDGVPDELAVPMAQWLATNGFKYLGIPITDLLSTYGYGDYREVPAVYAMKFIAPDVLGSALGAVQPYMTDFHLLFKKFSKTLKSKINTSTDIIYIWRGWKNFILYWKRTEWLPRVQSCSEVVVAFTPTVSALKTAGFQLSKKEKELFELVGTDNYYSSAVRAKQFPNGISLWGAKPNALTPVEPEGQPVYFKNLMEGSDVVSGWSWDKYRKTPDEKKSKKQLLDTLSKFNKDPREVNMESMQVSEKDILAFMRVIDYFPHLDPDALKAGWYKRFNALQGKQGTYYATTLSGFEMIEFAVRAGQEIGNSIS